MHFNPRQMNVDVVVPVVKILHRGKNTYRDQKTQHDVIGRRLPFLTVAFTQEFHGFLPRDFFQASDSGLEKQGSCPDKRRKPGN